MTNAKTKPYRPPQVWVSCDRWPDPGRLKTFVRDIFRIERPRTDEQRALAVYRWITRTFMWGGQTVEGPPNMWAVEPDLIKTLNVHGYGYCDGWGRLFSALWQAAGREAYKIVIYNDTPVPAHTLSEIWYNDADGVYRPHAFDVFHQVAVRTRDGSRICSFDEMFADKSLVTDPTDPVLPFYIRDDQRAIHANAKYIGYPIRSVIPPPHHDIRPVLRPGTELTRLWRPLGHPYRTDGVISPDSRCASSLHDSYTAYLPDGSAREPENEPFYRPYLRRCTNRRCKQYGQLVRFYANGRFRYRPKLVSNADLARAASHPPLAIRTTRNRLAPQRPLHLATFVMPVQCPYIFTDGLLNFSYVKKHPGDYVGVHASTDGGKTWRQVYQAPVRRATRPRKVRLDLGAEPYKRREVSIFGRYDLWLRWEMVAIDNAASVSIGDIEFDGIFHHNPHVAPRLMPGDNRWRVDATSVEPSCRLSVELCWDDLAGKNRRQVHRIRARREQFNVRPRAKQPADIRMQALTIRCD